MSDSKYIDGQYYLLVHRLFKPGEEILATLTPHRVDLIHAASGVAGEGGEVLDEVKKMFAYNRSPLDPEFRDKMRKEMGDIEFYLEKLRQLLGMTREEILQANMDKLQRRYTEGYSDSAANARKDTKTYTPLIEQSPLVEVDLAAVEAAMNPNLSEADLAAISEVMYGKKS